jgi:hypothetical protein
MPIFLLLFTLLLPARGDATDRCSTPHCTCLVRPGDPPEVETYDRASQRRFVVRFQEGEYAIDSRAAQEIASFVSRFENSSALSITVIGYTDGCGTASYNMNLARQRAVAARTAIRATLPTASISTQVVGENSTGHKPEARTVDIVVHTRDRLTTRIEKIPADVYLIDGSGSMWRDMGEWRDVVNASVRPGSRIYVSMMNGCYSGQRLNSITPSGGTEIWYSYWWVINGMSQGETLLIISDFQSNYQLQQWERDMIRRAVQARGITVRRISN